MSYTSPELHFIRLLSERFDIHELYRALLGLSDEAPLKARLMVPTSTTPLAFATHAVSVLSAEGLVQRGLFAALVAQRQTLAGEIWGVAALFGVSHPDAAPVEALPDHFAALVEANAALRTFIGRAEQLELLRAVLLPLSCALTLTQAPYEALGWPPRSGVRRRARMSAPTRGRPHVAAENAQRGRSAV